MTQPSDIYWLAGLLEGEGYFGLYKLTRAKNVPRIGVQMADRDVIERAALLFRGKPGVAVWSREPRQGGPLNSTKTLYLTTVDGALAAGWMMTLYPFMGLRRKDKIRECLAAFSSNPILPGRVSGIWKRHTVAA